MNTIVCCLIFGGFAILIPVSVAALLEVIIGDNWYFIVTYKTLNAIGRFFKTITKVSAVVLKFLVWNVFLMWLVFILTNIVLWIIGTIDGKRDNIEFYSPFKPFSGEQYDYIICLLMVITFPLWILPAIAFIFYKRGRDLCQNKQ